MTAPLKIHFLNVGRGDCIIVQHPLSGNVTMVDINNVQQLSDTEVDSVITEATRRGLAGQTGLTSNFAATYEQRGMEKRSAWRAALGGDIREVRAAYGIELQDPIEYLLEYIGANIFRFINTHPDSDHFTGLHTLDSLRRKGALTISNFWHINDTKKQGSFQSDAERDSWTVYQQWKQESFARCYLAGGWQKYFNQSDIAESRGDSIYVLSPDAALVADARRRFASRPDIYNNASFVLLLIHGKARIILSGDAFGNAANHCPADSPQAGNMPNTWRHLLDTQVYNRAGRSLLTGITLLKAAHHGLKSGFHDEAVPTMAPKITIVSEGKKTDNDAQARYSNALSTRFYGNVVADVHETGDVFLYTEKYRPNHGSRADTNEQGYYLNANSYVTPETLARVQA